MEKNKIEYNNDTTMIFAQTANDDVITLIKKLLLENYLSKHN